MQIEYDNFKFDSTEEMYFYMYCKELKSNGFIDDLQCQPLPPFILSKKVEYNWTEKLKTKEVIKTSTILQPHEYTCDFKIIWNKKAYGIFYFELFDGNKLDKIPFVANQPRTSYIECKPAFDYQNMTRLATINIKLVYEQYKIYVQKVIPVGKKSCLFADTFVPTNALYTPKTKQLKKFKFQTKTLNEFIKNGK